MRCDFCGSDRGVKEYKVGNGDPDRLCIVCSRLLGIKNTDSHAVLYAIVHLFHALGKEPLSEVDGDEPDKPEPMCPSHPHLPLGHSISGTEQWR